MRSSARRSLTRIPACGRDGGRERDHQRDGQAERVRAGDHQHGDRCGRRRRRRRRAAPHDERDDRGRRWRRRTAARRTGRRAPGHGCWTACASATSRWMPASAVSSPTASTRTRIDESVETVPATTRSPTAFGDRPRLAGDHRLVELGVAVDDLAVGRHPATGTDQHDVADAQLGRPARSRDPSPSITLGVVGEQLGERGERASRLADRLHLLPVAEQHDRDQRGELPPELEVEPAEAGRHRRHVGDGDRHRDQQHHPRLRGRGPRRRRRRGTASRPRRRRTCRARGPTHAMPGKSSA